MFVRSFGYVPAIAENCYLPAWVLYESDCGGESVCHDIGVSVCVVGGGFRLIWLVVGWLVAWLVGLVGRLRCVASER